ncbi:ThuA domain-containing protein [Agriterribacter sp.]|uniref:ThuA domain-containing protein n=1 Tax=Agriterribacter sp. TaxID=2821509 RepID=UPI002BAAF574|nr:ThuA domain-containing protein [Agriterribacter sp.]HTN05342.1 ThuA domain-containing protein [Agriterribacter sp.]
MRNKNIISAGPRKFLFKKKGQSRNVFCSMICLTLAAIVLGGIVAAHPKKSIRVLIVTGMDIDAHHWRETTLAAMKELSNDPRIHVDTLTDIYQLGSVNLDRYDVLYLNFNNWGKPDPDTKAENNLKQFVANGGGLVIVHFASGSFESWPEYIKLAGKVWDRKNTHDPRGPFRVEIVDSLHPVTKGMTSYDTDDELYICLTGNEPVHLLARAKSVITGTYHPMAFTLTYKKGRIFHTALGHDARAIHVPGTAELIRRGVAWAAG